eukprot:scaffold85737_cov56-Cyclotella_meneghiniana.AAC.10
MSVRRAIQEPKLISSRPLPSRPSSFIIVDIQYHLLAPIKECNMAENNIIAVPWAARLEPIRDGYYVSFDPNHVTEKIGDKKIFFQALVTQIFRDDDNVITKIKIQGNRSQYGFVSLERNDDAMNLHNNASHRVQVGEVIYTVVTTRIRE